jgi:hypothetical protein
MVWTRNKKRDEGELIKDIMKWRNQKKMWVIGITDKVKESRLIWCRET